MYICVAVSPGMNKESVLELVEKRFDPQVFFTALNLVIGIQKMFIGDCFSQSFWEDIIMVFGWCLQRSRFLRGLSSWMIQNISKASSPLNHPQKPPKATFTPKTTQATCTFPPRKKKHKPHCNPTARCLASCFFWMAKLAKRWIVTRDTRQSRAKSGCTEKWGMQISPRRQLGWEAVVFCF